MEWTNEKIVRLIKEIEIKPVIWDSCHADYKNRNLKRDTVNELAEMFECDSPEILRKWKIILAQYRREKQKLRASRTVSHESYGMYKPTWFGYKYLQFLRDPDEPNEITHFLDNTDQQDNCQQSNDALKLEGEIKKTTEHKKTRGVNRNIPLSPGTSAKSLKRKTDISTEEEGTEMKRLTRDDCDVFGEHVAFSLRSLPNKEARSYAKYQISNILYQTEMKKFPPLTSDVNTPPGSTQSQHSGKDSTQN